MSNWKQAKLTEVIEIVSGGTPKRNCDEFWNGDIPWLSVADFNNDMRFVSKSQETITKLGLEKSSTKLLNENDLIISARGTVGCLAQLSIPMAFNQSCYGLRGKDGIIDNGFLYYFLKNSINQLKQITHGAVFDTITRNTFESIEIKFPTLDKQKEISNILGNFDQKIQLNTQINQILEQIAQAVFKSWFIDFDPVRAKAAAKAQGATDEQAEQAAVSVISGKSPAELTAYRQTHPSDYEKLAQLARHFPSEFEVIDGVEVPKGWGIFRIDDVIEKIPVGKKYSQKTVTDKGDIPVLDQGKSGIIGYHNDKAGVIASIDNPVIVFANHTCYMRLISYPFSAIQNVFAFKGKEVNIFWLYLATLGKQEFVEYKGHFPDFLIKGIIVPNTELTNLFGNFITEKFMKCFINEEENKTLSELRDLLLPNLLSREFGNA